MKNDRNIRFFQALRNRRGGSMSGSRRHDSPAGAHATRSATLAVLVAGAFAGAAISLCAAPGQAHSTHQASQPAKASAAKASAEHVANGKRLFKKVGCYECHGLEAQGSPTSGLRLGPDPIPLAAMVAYVRHPAGQMPPYTAKVLSDKQLADIYAFLKSLPHPPPVSKIPLLH